MKRSIAVVVAGRGLMILWVFATAQVMCIPSIDEDSEVYQAISDHKEGMVTHMINTKGLQKASIQLHMSPLSVTDILKPSIDDDDDDTAAKGQPHHIRRLRKRPRAPAFMASNEEKQYNKNTETNDEPKVKKSQENELPKIDNSEMMKTKRDHESLIANDEDESKNFEGRIPRSNLVSKNPKVKRKSMKKSLEHPIPSATV